VGAFLRAWPVYHQQFSGGSRREGRAHLRLHLAEWGGPRVEEPALMLIDPYPWSALWRRCGSGRADGSPGARGV
jgi:hypothetical protein